MFTIKRPPTTVQRGAEANFSSTVISSHKSLNKHNEVYNTQSKHICISHSIQCNWLLDRGSGENVHENVRTIIDLDFGNVA